MRVGCKYLLDVYLIDNIGQEMDKGCQLQNATNKCRRSHLGYAVRC